MDDGVARRPETRGGYGTPGALIAAGNIAVDVPAALFGPLLVRTDPLAPNRALAAFAGAAPHGTDKLRRDVLKGLLPWALVFSGLSVAALAALVPGRQALGGPAQRTR